MTNQQDDIDRYWMGEALKLARIAAENGEVPVGAVLVDAENRQIGKGWNNPIGSNDPTGHAEIIALRDASGKRSNYRLPDTTLYVTVEPCTMCVGAMIHARIKRLVFGALEPKAGAVVSQTQLLGLQHLNHRVEFLQGVCAMEAAQLMSDFFAKRRAVKKQNND